MGFLLLQYEFQRANREVNLCNRKTVRINNQLTRATKRIEKMESVFAKEKTANETKWNNISSSFSQQISMAGMSITQNAASINDAITNFNGLMMGINVAGVCLGTLVQLSPSSFTAKSNDPTAVKSAIMTAINGAIGQAQQMMKQLIEQGKSLEEAALEQRQDSQLQPLSEMEGDLQAEQSLNDTLTSLWEQRRDSAKEKLPQAIENATGHFGLK